MTVSMSASSSVQPPSANSTASYWHRQPSKLLMGHRTTPALPTTADVVVVGSGITGTFAARELVAAGRKVVMLEAREACWGATGRNGGHCHPGVWTNTPEVARFELETFNLIKDLITEHGIPCDWAVVGAIHPIFSPTILEAAKKRVAALQEHPDLKDKAILIEDKDELANRRVPTARAAVYHPYAARLWPYKLVTWILERLLHEHDASTFNLQTHTQVDRLERLSPSEPGESRWMVHTQRGPVAARQVLLACNGHTAYLLPRMDNLIIPGPGQVCALEPPASDKTATPYQPLPHSCGWFSGLKSYDDKYLSHNYLIQRGPSDIVGSASKTNGVNGAHHTNGTNEPDQTLIFGADLTGPYGDLGRSRDDELNPVLSQMLRERLPKILSAMPSDVVHTSENLAPATDALKLVYEWTGIMGWSRDGVPWVGQVPAALTPDGSDGDGLWLCAAYTGHGMPVAARCGIAVAESMVGKTTDRVRLPQDWVISEERARKAREMEMPLTVDDMADLLAC